MLEHFFQIHSAVKSYLVLIISVKYNFFLLPFLLLNYHGSNFPLRCLAVQNVNGLFQHRNEMNFIWITNYICIIAHVKILFLTQAFSNGARLCLSYVWSIWVHSMASNIVKFRYSEKATKNVKKISLFASILNFLILIGIYHILEYVEVSTYLLCAKD